MKNCSTNPSTLPTLSLARRLPIHGPDSTGCSHVPISCELPCQCQISCPAMRGRLRKPCRPACLHITPFHECCQHSLPHMPKLRRHPLGGKHGQISARERGLDFGWRLIIVGRCGNHFTTPLQLRPPLGEVPMLQNVTQPTPLSGPPQEAGPSRVRALTSLLTLTFTLMIC